MARRIARNSSADLREEALRALPGLLGSYPIEAVAFQGGLGRGQVDQLSDIDLLLVFSTVSQAAGAPKGELIRDGVHWSIFQLCLDKVTPQRRLQLAVDLLTECADEAIRCGFLPDDMGSFYFPCFSTHSDNTDE